MDYWVVSGWGDGDGGGGGFHSFNSKSIIINTS